jgi:glycosyltransferase involved in cell wall biosynthesis
LLPAISIVCPCFNHGGFVKEMLESVWAQSFPAYEVVLVNDGSTDDTQKILDGLLHEKLTVIHTANRGPAAARNKGIAKARAPIILNLDADDKIAPSLLEKAYRIFQADPQVGIVHSEVRFFGARTGRFELPAYSLSAMLKDNVIHSTAFFRKADWQAVGGYSDDLVYGLEDWDFWLSILALNRRVHKIPEDLVFYRRYRNPQACRSGKRVIHRRKLISARLMIFDRHREVYAQEPSVYHSMVSLKQSIMQENWIMQSIKNLHHSLRSRWHYR